MTNYLSAANIPIFRQIHKFIGRKNAKVAHFQADSLIFKEYSLSLCPEIDWQTGGALCM